MQTLRLVIYTVYMTRYLLQSSFMKKIPYQILTNKSAASQYHRVSLTSIKLTIYFASRIVLANYPLK